MSTAAINPKGARQIPAEIGPLGWAMTYLGSSVGQKILVAITGSLLVFFLIFHMIGNLKVFSGPDSMNAYAYFLKHELGILLWVARGGLLALFLIHIVVTINLKARSVAARPVGYLNQRSAQATIASKTMIWTGIVIGAFTLFHLAHYTFGWVKGAEVRMESGQVVTIDYLSLTDAKGRHDVYEMMIAGFRTPWVSVTYVIAQLLLFVHLSHGIQSVFQTLGLKGTRFAPAWRWLALLVAGSILAGNLAIVFAVWTGTVGPQYPLVN